MTLFKPTALLLLLFLGLNSHASFIPVATTDSSFSKNEITAKKVEQLTGKKLTLLQKVELKILQRKLHRHFDKISPEQEKQAKLSLIFGIVSICFLALSSTVIGGILALLSIPAAILAIIFGAKSLKGNSNVKGIIGIVLGGLSLLLIVLALFLVLILIAGLGYK